MPDKMALWDIAIPVDNNPVSQDRTSHLLFMAYRIDHDGALLRIEMYKFRPALSPP